MSDDLTRAIARTIWETSRRDEGTISATGANIIAAALASLIEARLREARAQGAADAYADVMRQAADHSMAWRRVAEEVRDV